MNKNLVYPWIRFFVEFLHTYSLNFLNLIPVNLEFQEILFSLNKWYIICSQNNDLTKITERLNHIELIKDFTYHIESKSIFLGNFPNKC